MHKYYLGLSVTYHDSALAIVNGQGEVLFAEATERFLQNKRALNCEPDQLLRVPELLRDYCPNAGEITIAINWLKKRPMYESVVAKLGLLSAEGMLKAGIKRLRSPLPTDHLHHMMACQRRSIAAAGLNLARMVREILPDCRLNFVDYDHHLTHAATASYGSPFAEAACAVLDSYGERGAMAFYRFRENRLTCLHETKGPGTASLGLYYMKITELCGFDWLKGEEWKVMGLAPYGKLNEELYDLLDSTIRIDGLDCRYVADGLFDKFAALNRFKRKPNEPPESSADVAHTGQRFFAETANRLLRHLHEVTGCDRLTLAGGCALNSSNNGHIINETPFKEVYVPSAPADDGCALGAAWLTYYADHPEHDKPAILQTPYTGSFISDETLARFVQFNRSLSVEHCPDSICSRTVELLAEGKLVGWIQGRAEFGPRALGNRSILADPRKAKMQDRINEQVKFREMFRPFAPSILHEFGPDYFENYQESPYMDKTLTIRKPVREKIAAVAHVDGTGRLQTVKSEWNQRFHQLITEFYWLSGVPVLLNTSFNVMGKPLIHSVEDALAVFMTTGLDVLVINDYLIRKTRESQ